MQYDRMDDEEKLRMYLELEPDLVVFDQTKNELELEKLREENLTVKQLREEIAELKENQAQNDQKMIEKLREEVHTFYY